MYKIKKPDVIFFDWDGTIVENSDFVECLSKSLFNKFPIKGHGKVADFEKAIDLAFGKGVTAKDAITYLYGKTDYNIDQILNFIKSGSLEFTPKLSTLEGVIDVIRLIHSKNISMCIASNRDLLSLKREVEELYLSQYFKEVLSFEHVDAPKPLPHIIYHGIKLFNNPDIKLSNCWLIGDQMTDIGCAINSGLIPFFVGKNEDLTTDFIDKIETKEVIKINKYSELGDIIHNF